MFEDVYNNQLVYKTYLKLFDGVKHKSNLILKLVLVQYVGDIELEYRMIFFIAGRGTLLKKGPYEGCKISPKTIYKYLSKEYGYRYNELFNKN